MIDGGTSYETKVGQQKKSMYNRLEDIVEHLQLWYRLHVTENKQREELWSYDGSKNSPFKEEMHVGTQGDTRKGGRGVGRRTKGSSNGAVHDFVGPWQGKMSSESRPKGSRFYFGGDKMKGGSTNEGEAGPKSVKGKEKSSN